MSRPDKFSLLNRKARGKLLAQIDTRRLRNDSYDEIAWWLSRKYGIRITGESVRLWHRRADAA